MAHAGPHLADPGGSEPVRVYTLGRFQVHVGDGPLQFEGRAHRKPLELLKVLIALGGEQVSSERLSEALWPDAEGDRAQATFSPTLLRLRRLIGQETVVLQDRRLTLDATRCWVDARAFAEALEQAGRAAEADDVAGAQARMEEALALYRGPFLEGEFEPIPILSARERLHGMFLRHLGALGDRLAGAGDPERAIGLYRRGLELDPLAESLYQALMGLHLRQGQAAEGIAVYRRCRELLAAEAGIQPSPETEALHRALLDGNRERGDPSAVVAAPAGPAAAGAPEAPEAPRPRRRWVRWAAAAAVLAVLAGGALLGWQQRGWWAARPAGDAGSPMALPLPEEPSIIVLPLENLTGEASQNYFATGLTENLTTELYKLPGLFVIARRTSEYYGDKQLTAQQIAREVGVRYVLEGSVQRSQHRVRVNVQLIEAATERHLWAERYDRELRDVFRVQDEIIRHVATELGVRLSWGEVFRNKIGGTENLQAWELYIQADTYFSRYTKADNLKARELLAQAIEADPGFARPMAMMGWSHLVDGLFRWSDDPAKSLRLARQWANRALAIDERVPLAHTALGRLLVLKGRHEEGITSSRRALEFEPNNPNTMASLAFQYVYAGRPKDALPLVTRALRLAPYPPEFYLSVAGYAYALTHQHQEAAVMFRRYLARNARGPSARWARHWLVASLMAMGREDDARAEVQAWLAKDPTVTLKALESQGNRQPFKDHGFLAPKLALVHRAGIPE